MEAGRILRAVASVAYLGLPDVIYYFAQEKETNEDFFLSMSCVVFSHVTSSLNFIKIFLPSELNH